MYKCGPKKYALDLFSGTHTVGNQLAKRGYTVISVDVRPQTRPTHLVDILEWDYSEYRKGYFDIIAASPPCTEYSQAKQTAPRRLEHADALVTRALEIIRYFCPRLWWIENPRGGLLKTRAVVANLPFIDIDYCQFSDWGYQKPT